MGNITYIHERPDWTNFMWDAKELIDIVSDVNREAGFLNGRLNAIGFDDQLRTAAEALASDIVASSSIEGISLDTVEVRSSVARKLGIKIECEKSSTHYVDGIVEMMLDATANYSTPVTDERLFAWHYALFPSGRSGIEKINVGKYRSDEMSVVSGTFGREVLHYRAPAAGVIEREMGKFLEWLNQEQPSYIKSAIAHLWFVSIHPFDDGNGRMARAISDMVLAQTEISGKRFYSVSAEISREKSSYYRVLEKTQKGDGDITEWLMWYLKCIRNAIRASQVSLSGVLRKAIFWQTHSQTAISERQRQVINSYLDGYEAKLTIKNYAKLCKISADTAARDMRDLVDKGILRPDEGRVRDVSYSFVFDLSAHDYGQLELLERDGEHLIVANLKDGRIISETVSPIDILRHSQAEITLTDIADKYFSFLKL